MPSPLRPHQARHKEWEVVAMINPERDRQEAFDGRRPGVTSELRIGIKPGQYGWSFAELEESWVTAEQVGFSYIACFDHVTSAPRGLVAWDAPTILAAMAGRTKTIDLSVEVLNAGLRHPFLLASQLAAVQALSGNRLRVGLGAGSAHLAKFDHQRLGLPFRPFAERVDQLAACCRLFPRLWAGDLVTDPALGLDEASLGPIDLIPPPILVAGASPRAIEIAATTADGWMAPADPDLVVDASRRLDAALEVAGRPIAIERVAQLFVDDLDWDQVVNRLDAFALARITSVTFVLHRERGRKAVTKIADGLRQRGIMR
jgi:alkanesulfonate monooxygenase SsuD/methylene tetrahydromethanopterin reductase-like flavin-dependent oxidoreductase (luciferase family)